LDNPKGLAGQTTGTWFLRGLLGGSPDDWSIAETVFHATLIDSPTQWLGAFGYALGLGLIKARAAGRDEGGENALLGMLLVEQLVEGAADILRGRLILSPVETTEGAIRQVRAFQSLHQGEIYAHLFYPFLVSEKLGSALISTAATATLIHYQNRWNLNEIRRVLQVWRPTESDLDVVYQPAFRHLMGMAVESAGYGSIEAWVGALESQWKESGRLPLRTMAFLVDPLQRHAFLPVGLVRGTLQMSRSFGTLGDWVRQSPWRQQYGGMLDELGRSAFYQSLGYASEHAPGILGVAEVEALRRQFGIDVYQMMKQSTEQLHAEAGAAYQLLMSEDQELAEQFMRTIRSIELGSLSSRATVLGVGLGIGAIITSSLLPALLDRILPGPANPIHRMLSERRRDRDVLDESTTHGPQPPEQGMQRQMRRYMNSLGWRSRNRSPMDVWVPGRTGWVEAPRETRVRVDARRRSSRSPRFQRERRIRRELQLDQEVH